MYLIKDNWHKETKIHCMVSVVLKLVIFMINIAASTTPVENY